MVILTYKVLRMSFLIVPSHFLVLEGLTTPIKHRGDTFNEGILLSAPIFGSLMVIPHEQTIG